LLDPYGEYKLNYNEGYTLKLNIKDKFNLDGFDLVVRNPPYNNRLFFKFSIFLLEITNRLLFVIPSNFIG